MPTLLSLFCQRRQRHVTVINEPCCLFDNAGYMPSLSLADECFVLLFSEHVSRTLLLFLWCNRKKYLPKSLLSFLESASLEIRIRQQDNSLNRSIQHRACIRDIRVAAVIPCCFRFFVFSEQLEHESKERRVCNFDRYEYSFQEHRRSAHIHLSFSGDTRDASKNMIASLL